MQRFLIKRKELASKEELHPSPEGATELPPRLHHSKQLTKLAPVTQSLATDPLGA